MVTEQSEPQPGPLVRVADGIFGALALATLGVLIAYLVQGRNPGQASPLWSSFLVMSATGALARYLYSGWRPQIAFTLSKSTVHVGDGYEGGRPVRYLARIETPFDLLWNVVVANLLAWGAWWMMWAVAEVVIALLAVAGAGRPPSGTWAHMSREVNSALSVGFVVVAFAGVISAAAMGR